jgi:DNA polymerase-3 subunit beta
LPPFELTSQVSVREADLRRAVEQTAFAVATDDARYGLNGAHVEVHTGPNGQRLRFVATDGHRLSAAELPFEGSDQVRFPARSLVPRKALAVIRKLLEGSERVQLEFGAGAIRLVQGTQSFWFRLLEGDFPDYGSLQQGGAHRVLVRREELLGSVRRVLLLVMDRSRSVRFRFQHDQVAIDLRSAERGEVEESLAIDLQGPPITVGFNPRYLQDILQVVDSDQVELSMANPLAPCWIRPPESQDAFFVVMPMSLD